MSVWRLSARKRDREAFINWLNGTLQRYSRFLWEGGVKILNRMYFNYKSALLWTLRQHLGVSRFRFTGQQKRLMRNFKIVKKPQHIWWYSLKSFTNLQEKVKIAKKSIKFHKISLQYQKSNVRQIKIDWTCTKNLFTANERT